MNKIKTWIWIAYGNLFAIFLNVFVMMWNNEIIKPCVIAIGANIIAFYACLLFIGMKTQK